VPAVSAEVCCHSRTDRFVKARQVAVGADRTVIHEGQTDVSRHTCKLEKRGVHRIPSGQLEPLDMKALARIADL